jgi:anti-anti-sigma factor
MTDEVWSLDLVQSNNLPIIKATGYFNDETGNRLNEIADELLEKGNSNIIIDFENCELMNSLGIAALLEMTLKTKEDYQGKVVFANPSQLLIEVFELAFLLPDNEVAESIEEAIKLF